MELLPGYKNANENDYKERFLLLKRDEHQWLRGWSNQTESFQVQAAKKNEQQCLNELKGQGAPEVLSEEDNHLRLTSRCHYWLPELDINRLSFEQKLAIASSVTSALAQVHGRNIFHFSVRPSSFIVSQDLKQAQVIDFSVARTCPKGSSGISAFYPYNADAHFLAPEQTYLLEQTIDNRTDLYSLGCVLIWLFTGNLPFAGIQDPEEIGYAHISRSMEYQNQLRIDDFGEYKFNVSELIRALVEKEAAHRYQSAEGVLKDISFISANSSSRLMADRDSLRLSDRLVIPQKLYGREQESKLLTDAFVRVTNGPSEAVLVAGYSGIGKSSLVHGIRKSVISSDGLYLSGKFDQFQRDVPYRAIEQALSQLVKHIHSLPDDEVDSWKERINKALFPNAQVLVEILPDLGRLLGPQPVLPLLGAEEQQNRFNRVFLDFIHTICTSYRPLVFFIDDIQWADMASINLIRLLIADNRSKNCLIVGAYRDNEVDEKHSFSKMLQEVEQLSIRLKRISLAPLSQQTLQQICSDTLQQPVEKVAALAKLIYEKTGGNPFFFRQFIQELYQRELLGFDRVKKKWSWSTEQIRQQNITDNVVSLMTKKLSRLPEGTKLLLQQAACIGASVKMEVLQHLSGQANYQQTLRLLQPALNAGLLIVISRGKGREKKLIAGIRFLHDRVQQAAYSDATDKLKGSTHYQVGKLLLDKIDSQPEAKEEYCFSIVSHLNRVHDKLSPEQISELIQLNLLAARKSKASSAYSTAVSHLNQLFRLIERDVNLDIAHQASIEKLECLYLAGRYEEAEEYQSHLEHKQLSVQQQTMLQVILITQYTRYGELNRAIEQGQKALAQLDCKLEGNMEALQAAIADAQRQLRKIPFSKLVDKPDAENEKVIRTLDILMAMQPCCYNSGSLLFPMTILKLLELTHLHGNSAYSSYVYTMYGLLCTKVLKDYPTAFEASHYSQIISRNYERNPLLQGRLSMMQSNFILPWQLPLRKSAELRDVAFQQCFEQGDYYWGVHAYIFGFYAELLIAPSIDSMLSRVERVIEICREIKQPAQVYLSQLQKNLLHILDGRLDNLVDLDHTQGYEGEACEFYQQTNYMCGKYDRLIGRLLQGYLFGNYEKTLNVTLSESLGQDELDEGIFHEAVYTQLSILSILALKQQHAEKITPYQQNWFEQAWIKYQGWYELNPDNFTSGYCLIKAELAAIEQDEINAYCFYEQAIQAAAKQGFALYQAIANERAGLYRQKLNQNAMATAYFEQARSIYSKWGAFAKSNELDIQLRETSYLPDRASMQHFDWRSVISASQDISQPLVLTELIHRMLQKTATLSGAQNVTLFQFTDRSWKGVAGWRKGRLAEECDEPLQGPESMLFYSLNTRKMLVVKDATHDQEYMQDSYVQQHNVCSALCLPLFVHDKMIGTLYLEHTETTNLFTAQRVQVLELLAGQFAISYQNASYYQQMEKQNELLEKAVDQRTVELNRKNKHLEVIMQAMPVPYGITTVEGSLIQANELFFECLELSKDQFYSVNASQFYADENDRKRMFAKLEQDGGITDFECEMRTYCGKLFWAVLTVTEIALDFGTGLFVTITDISDRKERERRLKHQAFTDPLTGAQNRRAFKRNAEELRVSEPLLPVSVAMLDIDHFKRLNDTYGHTAGDIVLRQFTEYIQSHLREKDIFGRLGGEEFGLIISHITAKEANKVVNRIACLVEQMVVTYEKQQIQFTVSIGLTCWDYKENFPQALSRADDLLYQAKQEGRNRVCDDIDK
ncbi:diguanylate cyclase [Vibrio sp. SCSIO 43137]|uniref:diguanylate cyclase n=1 Tax=Vibrio sp. SCSIO 43137 TaxID=3021011 RepID=UPI0023078E07|nr:diguanylate cyclase [Vibrio sp. SCSIO 43137]WCE28384.1 diguanylate cyclase [Vibrio sp. SCSIO 43137]